MLNVLDVLALLAAGVGAFAGWYSGWIVRVGRIAVLLLATLVARVMIVPIAGFWQRITDSEPQSAVASAFLVLLVVAYGVLFVGLSRLTGELRDQDWRAQWDRFAGGLAGAVEGLAIVFVIGVVMLNFSYGGGVPDVAYDESRLGRFVMARDFLRQPALDVLTATDLFDEEGGERRRLRGFERHHLGEGEE